MPDLRSLPFVDHIKPIILLSLNTGMRRGEVFTLQWKDIDWNNRTLSIPGPNAKSGSTRHIPLNQEAFNTLEFWKTMSLSTTSDSLVFPGKGGSVLIDTKHSWQTILKLAEIENFRWHDMRHHFASRLVMAGVDLNTVRELLGHSDLKMTIRYAHLCPKLKAAAVEKLDHRLYA